MQKLFTRKNHASQYRVFFCVGPFLTGSNYGKELVALPNAAPIVSSIDSREDTISCLETIYSIFNLYPQ